MCSDLFCNRSFWSISQPFCQFWFTVPTLRSNGGSHVCGAMGGIHYQRTGVWDQFHQRQLVDIRNGCVSPIYLQIPDKYIEEKAIRAQKRERERLVTIAQTAWLNICLISQGVMSNSAPTHTLPSSIWQHAIARKCEDKQTKGKVRSCFLFPSPQNQSLQWPDLLHMNQVA